MEARENKDEAQNPIGANTLHACMDGLIGHRAGDRYSRGFFCPGKGTASRAGVGGSRAGRVTNGIRENQRAGVDLTLLFTTIAFPALQKTFFIISNNKTETLLTLGDLPDGRCV